MKPPEKYTEYAEARMRDAGNAYEDGHLEGAKISALYAQTYAILALTAATQAVAVATYRVNDRP